MRLEIELLTNWGISWVLSPTLGTISECFFSHHRERSVDLQTWTTPTWCSQQQKPSQDPLAIKQIFLYVYIHPPLVLYEMLQALLWGQKSLLLFPVLAMRTLGAHLSEFRFVGSLPLDVLHPPQGQEGAHPLQCPTHLEEGSPGSTWAVPLWNERMCRAHVFS